MIGFFNLYVKSIHGSPSYRLEESRQVNQEIRYAIPEIMNISQTINHSYYDYVNFNIFNNYLEILLFFRCLFLRCWKSVGILI